MFNDGIISSGFSINDMPSLSKSQVEVNVSSAPSRFEQRLEGGQEGQQTKDPLQQRSVVPTTDHWALQPPLKVLTVRQRAARTSPEYHKKIFYQNGSKIEDLRLTPANAAASSTIKARARVSCTLIREENPWGRVSPGQWEFVLRGDQLVECDAPHATLLHVLAHKVWRGRHGKSRAGRGRGGVPVHVRLVFSKTYEHSFFIRARSTDSSLVNQAARRHSALLPQPAARRLSGPMCSIRLNPFPSEIYVRSERATRYALYLDSRRVRKFRVQVEWNSEHRAPVRARLIHRRPGVSEPTSRDFILREGQDWLTLASDASRTLTDVLAHGVWVPREQVQYLTLEFTDLSPQSREIDFQLRSRRSTSPPGPLDHPSGLSRTPVPGPFLRDATTHPFTATPDCSTRTSLDASAAMATYNLRTLLEAMLHTQHSGLLQGIMAAPSPAVVQTLNSDELDAVAGLVRLGQQASSSSKLGLAQVCNKSSFGPVMEPRTSFAPSE